MSTEQLKVMNALHTGAVAGDPRNRSIVALPQQKFLSEVAGRPLPRGDGHGATEASNQPPLYYALEAVPYWISPSHRLLARLALMRLGSALLAGITVLSIYLFLMEALPRAPWSWTVGALAVAFQPTFGYVSGGVTSDNLLFAASAAVFLILSRAFRRGLTTRRGLYLGAAVAAGALAKLTFLGLVPGIVLGVGLLATGRGKAGRRWPAVCATAVAGAAPLIAYAIVSAKMWSRPVLSGTVGDVVKVPGARVGARGDQISTSYRLSYLWQLYLPRLPFMRKLFDYFPPYETWLKGGVGRFGWLDFGFPAFVYQAAATVYIGLAGLAGYAVGSMRVALKSHWREAVTYGVMAGGLLAEIAFAGLDYRQRTGYIFEQARYLLPLLSLYAAIVVLALRAFPVRIGSKVGVGLVLLAMAHSVFAQLLTISRYYG